MLSALLLATCLSSPGWGVVITNAFPSKVLAVTNSPGSDARIDRRRITVPAVHAFVDGYLTRCRTLRDEPLPDPPLQYFYDPGPFGSAYEQSDVPSNYAASARFTLTPTLHTFKEYLRNLRNAHFDTTATNNATPTTVYWSSSALEDWCDSLGLPVAHSFGWSENPMAEIYTSNGGSNGGCGWCPLIESLLSDEGSSTNTPFFTYGFAGGRRYYQPRFPSGLILGSFRDISLEEPATNSAVTTFSHLLDDCRDDDEATREGGVRALRNESFVELLKATFTSCTNPATILDNNYRLHPSNCLAVASQALSCYDTVCFKRPKVKALYTVEGNASVKATLHSSDTFQVVAYTETTSGGYDGCRFAENGSSTLDKLLTWTTDELVMTNQFVSNTCSRAAPRGRVKDLGVQLGGGGNLALVSVIIPNVVTNACDLYLRDALYQIFYRNFGDPSRWRPVPVSFDGTYAGGDYVDVHIRGGNYGTSVSLDGCSIAAGTYTVSNVTSYVEAENSYARDRIMGDLYAIDASEWLYPTNYYSPYLDRERDIGLLSAVIVTNLVSIDDDPINFDFDQFNTNWKCRKGFGYRVTVETSRNRTAPYMYPGRLQSMLTRCEELLDVQMGQTYDNPKQYYSDITKSAARSFAAALTNWTCRLVCDVTTNTTVTVTPVYNADVEDYDYYLSDSVPILTKSISVDGSGAAPYKTKTPLSVDTNLRVVTELLYDFPQLKQSTQ